MGERTSNGDRGPISPGIFHRRLLELLESLCCCYNQSDYLFLVWWHFFVTQNITCTTWLHSGCATVDSKVILSLFFVGAGEVILFYLYFFLSPF